MILDCLSKTFKVIPLLFICLGLRIIEYVQRPRTPKTSNMESFATAVNVKKGDGVVVTYLVVAMFHVLLIVTLMRYFNFEPSFKLRICDPNLWSWARHHRSFIVRYILRNETLFEYFWTFIFELPSKSVDWFLYDGEHWSLLG